MRSSAVATNTDTASMVVATRRARAARSKSVPTHNKSTAIGGLSRSLERRRTGPPIALACANSSADTDQPALVNVAQSPLVSAGSASAKSMSRVARGSVQYPTARPPTSIHGCPSSSNTARIEASADETASTNSTTEYFTALHRARRPPWSGVRAAQSIAARASLADERCDRSAPPVRRDWPRARREIPARARAWSPPHRRALRKCSRAAIRALLPALGRRAL